MKDTKHASSTMVARSRAGKGSKAAAKAKPPAQKEVPKPDEQERTLRQKIFDRDVDLSPEEVLMAAHWIRQATGLIVGTIFGILRMTGFPAILTFFVISFVGPPTLLKMLHELDIEEVSKVSSIQTEGFMPSFALFVLSWIISYTVFLPPST